MRNILGICLLSLALPVLASNPGEPLDCSDWVIVEPGYSCQTLLPAPCISSEHKFCDYHFSGLSKDNEGRHLRILSNVTGMCGATGEVRRYNLWAIAESGDTLIAYIDDRCVDNATGLMDLIQGGSNFAGTFDTTLGRFVFPFVVACTPSDCYPQQKSVIAIVGFATTFDVLQTFTPTADELSFHVPYMPEGFQYADYFDTYTGDLATVGDWSQATPLACGYPATSPSVGDYLTVADTLPDPAPGQGRYYVTVANYMGQRRYGRKNIGGVLSGRDPAVLPPCTN